MLGCWGTLWSLAQGLPLELGLLRGAAWGPHLLLPFLGFAASMFAFYRCASARHMPAPPFLKGWQTERTAGCAHRLTHRRPPDCPLA